MEETLRSVKIKSGKKFVLLWILIVALLVAALGFCYLEYSEYKEGQAFAVALVLATTDEFDEYSDDYKTCVEEIYDFYNPSYLRLPIGNQYVDNSDVVEAARKADKAFGTLLDEAGYDCGYSGRGSKYLEYVGFVDYSVNTSGIWFIIIGSLAFVLFIINLFYASAQKRMMIIDGDNIICKKGAKTKKQFMIRDVKSVAAAGKNGLRIKGNSIRYKIGHIRNSDELRRAIVEKLTVAPANPAAIVNHDNSAESIMKYKELLDMGVITQEEFDVKKKQLLGL